VTDDTTDDVKTGEAGCCGGRTDGRKARGRPSSRDRIVSAAGDLIRCEGAARLSLDAVAERAAISKGGLLYNFRTKRELLHAVIADYVETLREESVARRAALGEGEPNRACRGHLAASLAVCSRVGPPPAGILAAIAEDPSLLDTLRAYNAELLAAMAADDDPDLSLIAFLAMEGLASLDLFDTNPLGESEMERVVARLEALLRRPPSDADR